MIKGVEKHNGSEGKTVGKPNVSGEFVRLCKLLSSDGRMCSVLSNPKAAFPRTTMSRKETA